MAVKWVRTCLLLITVVATACTATPTAAPTAGTVATALPSDVAAGLPSNGRVEGFREAYAVALGVAQTWNAKAALYEIAPTAIMAKNLGQPIADTPGWFFMFRDPASPVEYYIMIVDGANYGALEAQPIVIGEPSYVLEPLAIDKVVVDDTAVLNKFMQDGGEAYVGLHPNFRPDYQLVHVQGLPNPVWSLYDGTDAEAAAVYHVDAVTGEKTTAPIVAPVS